MPVSRSTVLPLLGLVAAYGGAVTLGNSARLSWDLKPQFYALPSPEVAQSSSFGFRNVLSDVFFLQAAQYFGNPFNQKDNYRYLPLLVELVVELDTRFKEPLLWGAIAVQRNLGNETWIHTAESTRLLRKGVARYPDDGRFYIFLAYNLAIFHHEYVEAAEVLQRALKLPNCPTYVPALITRLYSAAGDLEMASSFADLVEEDTQDPNLKALMEERKKDIATERIARELDLLAKLYRERTGNELTAPFELVTSGILAYLPPEPRGGTWKYEANKHRIESDRMVGRLIIEDAPRRPQPRPTSP